MKKPLCGILILFLLPIFTAIQAQEYGLASFYSDEFDGRGTAYGEIYDKDKYTCAHKKHALGTMLRITRLDNKKSVDVRVNDKGPYIKGRVVDVSKIAARQLGLLQDGVAEVKIEVIGKASGNNATAESEPKIPQTIPKPAEETSPRITTTETEPEEKAPVKKETTSSTTSQEKEKVVAETNTTKTTTTSTSSNATYRLVTKDYKAYDVYRIRLERPTNAGFGVQVVSLSNYENVLRQVADLQAKGFDDILVSVEPDFDQTTVYKIILGSFPTLAQAKSYQSSLKKRYKLDGFVVDLNERP